jgi:hypothetical protein
MKISRKRFFKDAAKVMLSASAGALGSNAMLHAATHTNMETPPWPWPYSPLDPEQARKLSHDCFYEYGCAYASFSGILKLLQDKVGHPFTSIPPEIMSFGGAGVKGWGTLCGTLNGAFAAISLVCDPKAATRLVDDLMGWYARSRLPTDRSREYAEKGEFKVDKGIKEIPQSRSGSPLCHISVTKWCKTTGMAAESPERFERCARLSGDVAARAILVLNKHAENAFENQYGISATAFECNKCHGPGGEEADVDAKMDCGPCHGDPHE